MEKLRSSHFHQCLTEKTCCQASKLIFKKFSLKNKSTIHFTHHHIDRSDYCDEVGNQNSFGYFWQYGKIDETARTAFAPKRNITFTIGTEEESQFAFRGFSANIKILRFRTDLFWHQRLRIEVARSLVIGVEFLQTLFHDPD